MKQYKYIWQDKNKQWWIAKEDDTYWWYKIDLYWWTIWVVKQLIEDEPTIREEIEEDVFEKIYNDFWWTSKIEVVWSLRKSIKKHLGITREELEKYSNYTNDIPMCNIIKLFQDRWLILDNN
jgi:hypothetical protein